MNVSFGSMFLLIVSGAISSALLVSGFFVPSFASIVLTIAGLYFLERREKKARAMLQDKPIY